MDRDKPKEVITPESIEVGQLYYIKGTSDHITILSTTAKDKMYPGKNIYVECSNGCNYFWTEQGIKERCEYMG